MRNIGTGHKAFNHTFVENDDEGYSRAASLQLVRLATCRLHDINPYDYFVDVLQRVGQHLASLVHQLTPRIWKEMFANNPLRSDLHDVGGRRAYTAG